VTAGRGRSSASTTKGDRGNGRYDEVVGYVTGFKEPLQAALRAFAPAAIAVNYSQGSEICDGLTHGMYLTLRETLAEIGWPTGSCRRRRSSRRSANASRRPRSATCARRSGRPRRSSPRSRISPPRPDRARGRGLHGGRSGGGRAPARLEPGDLSAVFTGPDTAQAHYGPTGRTVEPGHILNMDFGVKVNGYCSDLQRTFYALAEGEREAPEDVKRGFRNDRPRRRGGQAGDEAGCRGSGCRRGRARHRNRRRLRRVPPRLGHQVGRFAHDGTALLGPAWEKYAQKPFQKLEEGMVFTIEPRLTVAGKGVVTIEEMVVVTKDGAEWLSRRRRSSADRGTLTLFPAE